jgi:hypothetical protein
MDQFVELKLKEQMYYKIVHALQNSALYRPGNTYLGGGWGTWDRAKCRLEPVAPKH